MASTTPSRNPSSPAVGSLSPDENASAELQRANGDQQAAGPRRSSFNFLRRQKSSESRPAGNRSVSGSKMSKKQKAQAQEEFLRKQHEAAMLPKQPPRLPSHSPLPQIENFGGDEGRHDSAARTKSAQTPIATGRASQDSEMAGHKAAPGSSPPFVDQDPYPRTESMTHRGRYSYASSAISSINSPRRVRRRKDPTPFNILVVGTKNSGKSSFIDFLRTALALPAKKRPHTPSTPYMALPPDSPFTSEYLETEMDGERIGVTLWDSQGLEKHIVEFQLPVITAFLESKFEETFTEEQKVIRAPGVRDTHIHCVFLVLDPARLDSNIAESRKRAGVKSASSGLVAGLDESLDINVLRELQGKTTVIPVISKADTITAAHMRQLKKIVWDSLKRAKVDPLEALHLGDESEESDEDRLDEREEDAYAQLPDTENKSPMANKLLDRSSSEAGRSDSSSTVSPTSPSPPASPSQPSNGSGAAGTHRRKASAMSAALDAKDADADAPYLPLSIISPDPYEPGVVGRQFAWGFADPYNADHCDFVRLRESVFSEWRAELREASREQWYEGWRTSRLQKGKGPGSGPGSGSAAARRHMYMSDSNGLAARGLSMPGVNGRAASAGGRQVRSTAGY